MVQKSPPSWATSVTALMAALTGEEDVPAVKTISLVFPSVVGSQARAATVGAGMPKEKSFRMSSMPWALKRCTRSFKTSSSRLSGSIVGVTRWSLSTRAHTWRSTSSHMPCKRDSSTVLPQLEPLNSLKTLNQSRGIQTSLPSFRRVAG